MAMNSNIYPNYNNIMDNKIINVNNNINNSIKTIKIIWYNIINNNIN